MTTKTKIIDGESFEISQPYAEGHVLTEAEAKALNQVRSENIGNNLRAAVKEAKEKNDTSNLAALVKDYDERYTFAMGGGGAATRKLDPIEREALKLAREFVKDHLAKDGRKLTVAPEGTTLEEWKAKVDEQVEALAQNEKIIAAAKKNVTAKKNLSDSILETLAGDTATAA